METSSSRGVFKGGGFDGPAALRASLDGGAIVLLGCAHLSYGAENAQASFLLSGILCVLALCRLALDRFAIVSPFVALVALLISVWAFFGGAGRWEQAGPELAALAGAGAIWLIGASAGVSRRRLDFIWSALVWMLLVFCIFAFALYALGGGAGQTRLSATFVSPNTAASVFVLSMLIAAGRISRQSQRRIAASAANLSAVDRLLKLGLPSLLLFAVASANLILSSSRAGIGFGAAALLCLFVLEVMALEESEKSNPRVEAFMGFAPLAAGFFILLAIVVAVGDTSLSQRVSGIDSAAGGRFELFGTLSQMWLDAPIFGHGLGSFNAVKNANETLTNAALLHQLGAAHNIVLQWLIQGGIVGLAGMLAVVALVHVPVLRSLFDAPGAKSRWARIALCASLYVVLHSQLDYGVEIPSILWTYTLILGLAYGEYRRTDREVIDEAAGAQDPPARI